MTEWNQPMSSTQPTGPNDPPFGYRPVLPPAPPPPKKSKKKWIILAVVAVACLLLFGGCVAFLGAVSESIDTTNKDIKQAPAQKATSTTEASVVDNENPYDTPKVSDFKLPVKELTRDRFGSAGDNVEYRVGLTQVTAKKYDPDKSYELSYDITGGESGRERKTMLIRGDEYEPYEGYTSTRSGVKITAKPISIEEV